MYTARNSRNRKNCTILMTYRPGTRVVVLDTETTGVDADRDHIVELAAQVYRTDGKGGLTKTEERDWYIRPPFRMEPKVVNVHHITNEFLADKPTEQELIDEIASFLGPKPLLVGYNVPFDAGMISSLYRRCGRTFTPMFALDVMEMARDVVSRKILEDFAAAMDPSLPETKKYQGHPYSLGCVVSACGLDTGITFHNALADTDATARLLPLCYQEYQRMPEPGTQALICNRFTFWDGHSIYQKGIWADTNVGKVYFSTYYKEWRSSVVDLSQFDIDRFEEGILAALGLSYADFSRLTKRRFEEARMRREEEGVVFA